LCVVVWVQWVPSSCVRVACFIMLIANGKKLEAPHRPTLFVTSGGRKQHSAPRFSFHPSERIVNFLGGGSNYSFGSEPEQHVCRRVGGNYPSTRKSVTGRSLGNDFHLESIEVVDPISRNNWFEKQMALNCDYTLCIWLERIGNSIFRSERLEYGTCRLIW
jgi:hypothetical protein